MYELIAATDSDEQLDITVSVSAGATLSRRSVVL